MGQYGAGGDIGRVLVVEDESSTRRTLVTVLDDFLVHVAEDVRRAECRLGQQTYDVILADQRLPDGTGLALLRYAHARNPATIGILLTGHAEDPEVEAARSTWRQLKILAKPCDAQSIRQSVEKGVERARMRAASFQLTRCS